MPRRFLSSLFNEDALHACFVRVHSRAIAEAFGAPPGHVPLVDGDGSPEIEPAIAATATPRLLRSRKRLGGRTR